MTDFFKQSEETVHSKRSNAHINATIKDLRLKIAKLYAKIYDAGRKGKFLKFEMEIRRKLIENYKSNFLNNNFEKLNDSLIREFLNYFCKLLPLKNKYIDWLSKRVKPIVNNTRNTIVLYISTTYIKLNKYKLSVISIKHFIIFLKFTKKLFKFYNCIFGRSKVIAPV